MVIRVLLVALGLWCLGATSARIALWDDERAVWADAVEKAPLKPRPWVNLGTMYQRDGHRAEAEGAYLSAMTVAQRPERSLEEQTAGYAVARANWFLLTLPRHEAASELANLLAIQEYRVTSIRQMQQWLAQQP